MFLGDSEGSDLFNLFCGKEIGRGEFRVVYDSHVFPDSVIKREAGEGFSNVAEWEIWRNLQGTKYEKWLAPVVWLSPLGVWMIQKKTQPITAKQLPKRVPDIFCDLKASNWGIYQGRPVCHDYGNHRLYAKASKTYAMRSAKWD